MIKLGLQLLSRISKKERTSICSWLSFQCQVWTLLIHEFTNKSPKASPNPAHFWLLLFKKYAGSLLNHISVCPWLIPCDSIIVLSKIKSLYETNLVGQLVWRLFKMMDFNHLNFHHLFFHFYLCVCVLSPLWGVALGQRREGGGWRAEPFKFVSLNPVPKLERQEVVPLDE